MLLNDLDLLHLLKMLQFEYKIIVLITTLTNICNKTIQYKSNKPLLRSGLFFWLLIIQYSWLIYFKNRIRLVLIS